MNKLYKTPIITSIVMLFLALFDLPEGYYTLLRIIVCGAAVYFLFIAKAIEKLSWVWIMGFIAILFNPFIPIYLDKEAWGIIDIIASVVFFIGIFALSNDGVFIIKKPYKKAFIILVIVLLTIFYLLFLSFRTEPKKIHSGTRNLPVRMRNLPVRNRPVRNRPVRKRKLRISEKYLKEHSILQGK